MKVAITEDFMDALGKLSGNEIKKASDANGLRAHKIEHPCDAIVSYRVNMDVRIIAYQKDENVTFLYIDHHDDAYHWVQNRNVFCGPNNEIRIVTTTEATPPVAFEAIIPYSNKKTVKAEITPQIVEELRNIPTLKGKEYKAGILILDDVVCQLLNINRILFNRIDTSLKAPKLNARFYLNLLYVVLSGFRDYITIMYPKDYKETITPILEE